DCGTVEDFAGVEIADASDGFLVDITAPVATIVEVPDPSLMVVEDVEILFNEPVNSVDISDFSLTLNGASVDISALTVAQTSSTEYSINLSTVTGEDGLYVLTVLANSTIFDTVGNPIAMAASDSFLVDTHDPTLDLTDVTGPDHRATPLGVITFTFSEPVFNVDSTDFTFTRDSGAGPVVVDITGLSVLQVTTTEYTLDLSTVTSDGGDGVTPLDGTYEFSFTASASDIVDAVGKSLQNDTSDVVTIDSTLPSANIVDVDPDPRSTPVGPVTILFSEDVTGVDISDFTLTRNGINVPGFNLLSVDPVSGSEYTIDLSTVTTADGDYVLTLVANGTIQDATGNPLETAASDSDAFKIDTALPTVSIVPVSPDPRMTNAGIVTINFSENVTGVDIGDFTFTFNGADVDISLLPFAELSPAQYTIDLSSVTATDGLYVLSLMATGSNIQDTTGLDLADGASEMFRVDTIAPTVTLTPVDPDPRNEVVREVFVQFDEDVTGVDVSDFALTFDAANDNPDQGAVAVNLSGLTVRQVIPARYAIDLSTVTANTGDYVLSLIGSGSFIRDEAGNELQLGVIDFFTVDFGFPTLTITRAGNSPTHQADNVQFNLVFSEEVTGVDESDFALNLQNVTADSAFVLGDAGDADPATYTITVNKVAGTGRLGLKLANAVNIADLSSNLLDPFISTESYTVVAPIVAFGSGEGIPGTVSVRNSVTNAEVFQIVPYGSFTGGIRVAVADFNGDGFVDIVTAPGPGGGPHIKVFDGQNGQQIHEFFAYGPSFKGGVTLAAADFDQDGNADILTGTQIGNPHVRVFNALTGDDFFSFFAYAPTFTGGVSVAAGDITGDGIPDIITGAGPGGGPHVRVFNGATPIISFAPPNINTNVGSFFAYSSLFTGGVFVASADVTGDGRADIITGAGAGGGPHVQVFSGVDGAILQSFFPYSPTFSGGVYVSTGFINGDGIADVITSAGPGGGPHVRAFAGYDSTVNPLVAGVPIDNPGFPKFAFSQDFNGGAFIAGNLPQGLVGNSLLVSGSIVNSGETVSLGSEDLQAIANAAVARLQATYGSSPAIEALAEIDLEVADLPDGELGRALPGRILIDVDAAGYGWFIDTTPFDDSEFSLGSALNAIDPSAIGRVDLLSVVLHELGHQLGAGHHLVADNPHHFMADRLSPSERRVPRKEDLDELFASDDLFDSLL
ncbi:MAG: FG-GAP repeat protein, partial [Planctomycetaceae bacterium]|nr:FG-GAP repeat protein [Planctomycetaceae bacterium]